MRRAEKRVLDILSSLRSCFSQQALKVLDLGATQFDSAVLQYFGDALKDNHVRGCFFAFSVELASFLFTDIEGHLCSLNTFQNGDYRRRTSGRRIESQSSKTINPLIDVFDYQCHFQKTLTTLRLSGTRIDGEGAQHLCEALKINSVRLLALLHLTLSSSRHCR